MQLPPQLRSALEAVCGAQSAGLRSAAAAVSDRYRSRSGDLQIRSADEARAYLATRLPATYAAARSVFAQVTRVRAEFAPASLLDVGAGPGTVALAALEEWPSVEKVTLMEPNPHLRRAGQDLFAALGIEAEWISGDVCSAMLPNGEHDLVVAGYMINEVVREGAADTVIGKLWRASRNALVVIEPGTPAGSGLVVAARDYLLAQGAEMIAPCPHLAACPLASLNMPEKYWCHFSERVERSKLHRAVKEGAQLGYEDEKFSYIAMGRAGAALPAHRVIGYPSGQKVVQLQLCNHDGSAGTVQIAKSHPQYKICRKAEWGDGIEKKL